MIVSCVLCIVFFMALQPLVRQGLLTLEASRLYSDTPTLRRIPLEEWSACRRNLYLTTQHSQETDVNAPRGIRARSPTKRQAADPRLRPRGQWDRFLKYQSNEMKGNGIPDAQSSVFRKLKSKTITFGLSRHRGDDVHADLDVRRMEFVLPSTSRSFGLFFSSYFLAGNL